MADATRAGIALAALCGLLQQNGWPYANIGGSSAAAIHALDAGQMLAARAG